MTQLFVPGAPRKGFDGAAIFATDPASGSPVQYMFADDMVRYIRSDNKDYPEAVDNAGLTHISIAGVKTGLVTVQAFLHPDRNIHTFLNTAFGPRTNGQLVPWTMVLVPNGGGAQIKAAGIWWATAQIGGRYAQRGGDGRIGMVLTGVVADPDNSLGMTDISLPSAGSNGAGVSQFIQAGFTDGQGSPVTYDLVRSFALSLNNQLSPQPSAKNRTARIGSGYTPGPLRGGLALSQMRNAVQSIPRTAGTYPLQILLPTGDGTHTTALDLSLSYDDDGLTVSPSEFGTNVISYNLFGTSAGATATAGWNMAVSYT